MRTFSKSSEHDFPDSFAFHRTSLNSESFAIQKERTLETIGSPLSKCDGKYLRLEVKSESSEGGGGGARTHGRGDRRSTAGSDASRVPGFLRD